MLGLLLLQRFHNVASPAVITLLLQCFMACNYGLLQLHCFSNAACSSLHCFCMVLLLLSLLLLYCFCIIAWLAAISLLYIGVWLAVIALLLQCLPCRSSLLYDCCWACCCHIAFKGEGGDKGKAGGGGKSEGQRLGD